MVRRKKTTVFLDTKKNTSMHKLKMIAAIINVGAENQMVYKGEQCMNDNKPLTKYSLPQSGSCFGIQTLESSRPSE